VSEEIATHVVGLTITRPSASFDHALLEIEIEVLNNPKSQSTGEDTPAFLAEECLPPPTTDLDLVLEEVLSARMTDDDATREFYGPVYANGPPLNLYIAA
jgi:hypothetical protein